ncbi:MAG: hypothetical protein LIP08_03270 [Bacteroides sp.]|nr:hypothetical protein [Bacteroides sp.]
MLDKDHIQERLKETFLSQLGKEVSEAQVSALDDVSEKMADVIIEAIRSIEISYQGGLVSPETGEEITGTFKYEIK